MFRSTRCTPKLPELPQQMESALTFLIDGCSGISPVQFIVQVNSQVLVICQSSAYQVMNV